MSLTYPIAHNGLEALTSPLGTARTKSGARAEVGLDVTLETEWLKPSEKEETELRQAIERTIGHGAAQRYEGENGATIIAINYWKPAGEIPAEVKRPLAGESDMPREDHADDLYFRHGRTRTSRKKGESDPNQMDLFGSPKEPD